MCSDVTNDWEVSVARAQCTVMTAPCGQVTPMAVAYNLPGAVSLCSSVQLFITVPLFVFSRCLLHKDSMIDGVTAFAH